MGILFLQGEEAVNGSYDLSFSLAMVALFGAAAVSYLINEWRYSLRYATATVVPEIA